MLRVMNGLVIAAVWCSLASGKVAAASVGVAVAGR